MRLLTAVLLAGAMHAQERTIAKHARLQEENQVLASRSEARRAELAAEAALAANRPQMGDTVAAAERRIDMFEMVAIDHAISRVRKHSKAARAEAKRLRAELDFKKGDALTLTAHSNLSNLEYCC